MKPLAKSISRRDLLRGAAAMAALPLLSQAGPEKTAAAQPESGKTPRRGQWHDKRCYFGFHHDLHVLPTDRDIGTHCSAEELAEMLRLTGADFIQTDSKGHPGLTSWFSKTPTASVGPGVAGDALAGWRAATRKLGLPLHAHYSGIFDVSAGSKHADWCIRGPGGQPIGGGFMGMTSPHGDRMCPRSPYVDELMIPQLLELIDRYGVDGFWIDGDLWAMDPCYCDRCRAAFRRKTGIAEPPKGPGDPHWPAWWEFSRESFGQYVAHYCDAVHRHKPGVLVCSNWLETLHDPGEPKAPTDWISGDNTAVWGLDNCRCEARFISTRGKPWDIMMWCFYSSHMQFGRTDWAMKPVEMLEQEAAVIVALGGNVQTCEFPFGAIRTGQLIPWRLKRIGQLAGFVERRRTLCQDAETIPQVAVLHSEHHARATAQGGNLLGSIDVTPVQGAVFSLLECHYGVDVLDEWAFLPRLARFPVVVVPEQTFLSQKMVDALKTYVRSGGKLLVSGAEAFERFGSELIGVKGGRVVKNVVYHVPAADGTVPILNDWRLMDLGGAKSLGLLGTTPLRDERLLPNPAATLNRVGRGAVAYVPCNIFRYFAASRYPLVRAFLGDVMRALAGRLEIEVEAPTYVDAVFRRQGTKRMVHLVNRSSGLPSLPNSGVIDEIPPVGPVTVRMSLPKKPEKVFLAFEDVPVKWAYTNGEKGGQLTVTVPAVHIHAAVVVVEAMS